MERRNVNPWSWQDQFGFSQAIEVSGQQRILICSGQTSNDADGNTLHAGDMRGQVGAALDNLETVLGAAGFSLSDVVRLAMRVRFDRAHVLDSGRSHRHAGEALAEAPGGVAHQ